jgi:copper(I)-binding protein
MKLLFSIAFLVTALFANDITVENAYVREVPPNMPNSAAFMLLNNSSDKEVALVSAESDVANIVEIHEHVHENGMMKMRQVPKIAIAPKAQTVLQPGGYHVMLIGLKQPLKAGQMVALTLKFSNDQVVSIEAPVQKIMMKHMQHQPKHHHGH